MHWTNNVVHLLCSAPRYKRREATDIHTYNKQRCPVCLSLSCARSQTKTLCLLRRVNFLHRPTDRPPARLNLQRFLLILLHTTTQQSSINPALSPLLTNNTHHTIHYAPTYTSHLHTLHYKTLLRLRGGYNRNNDKKR